VSPTLAADIGLRLASCIFLVAALNFLGLGLQPPTSDWGLMIAENRIGISLNPFVLIVPALLIGLLTVLSSFIGDSIARPSAER
jgi:peptide/nickel transport system permease protein